MVEAWDVWGVGCMERGMHEVWDVWSVGCTSCLPGAHGHVQLDVTRVWACWCLGRFICLLSVPWGKKSSWLGSEIPLLQVFCLTKR